MSDLLRKPGIAEKKVSYSNMDDVLEISKDLRAKPILLLGRKSFEECSVYEQRFLDNFRAYLDNKEKWLKDGTIKNGWWAAMTKEQVIDKKQDFWYLEAVPDAGYLEIIVGNEFKSYGPLDGDEEEEGESDPPASDDSEFVVVCEELDKKVQKGCFEKPGTFFYTDVKGNRITKKVTFKFDPGAASNVIRSQMYNKWAKPADGGKQKGKITVGDMPKFPGKESMMARIRIPALKNGVPDYFRGPKLNEERLLRFRCETAGGTQSKDRVLLGNIGCLDNYITCFVGKENKHKTFPTMKAGKLKPYKLQSDSRMLLLFEGSE